MLGDGIGPEIRALNFVAQIQQHLGNATHAAATDADEVNGIDAPHTRAYDARSFQARAHAAPRARVPPANATHASASCCVACGRAMARARSAIASSLPRPAHNGNSSAARRSLSS